MLKGWLGEKGVQFGIWLNLPKEVYPRLHDVILPDDNGTTQIDHVLVSKYGIFVIETKNYEGWIFGDENSPKWMQMFPNGKKFPFQNPIRQNYRHIMAIAAYLGIPKSKIHGLVMFMGGATLKTPMPPNVMSGGYITYITSFKETLLSNEEVARFYNALRDAKDKPVASKREHIANLHKNMADKQARTLKKPEVRQELDSCELSKEDLNLAGIPLTLQGAVFSHPNGYYIRRQPATHEKADLKAAGYSAKKYGNKWIWSK